MQQAMYIIPAPESHVHVRLVVESFDSGDECSFEHLAQLCTLVEDSDEAGPETDEFASPELQASVWN